MVWMADKTLLAQLRRWSGRRALVAVLMLGYLASTLTPGGHVSWRFGCVQYTISGESSAHTRDKAISCGAVWVYIDTLILLRFSQAGFQTYFHSLVDHV